MTTIIRAPDRDEWVSIGAPFKHRSVLRGRVSWRDSFGKLLGEGDELTPHQSVGSIATEDLPGWDLNIGVESFGRVARLLVADGDEVAPGDPLMEFEDRPPTTEEYWREWERAFYAEARAMRLSAMLNNPFRAVWSSLLRRHRSL